MSRKRKRTKEVDEKVEDGEKKIKSIEDVKRRIKREKACGGSYNNEIKEQPKVKIKSKG